MILITNKGYIKEFYYYNKSQKKYIYLAMIFLISYQDYW